MLPELGPFPGLGLGLRAVAGAVDMRPLLPGLRALARVGDALLGRFSRDDCIPKLPGAACPNSGANSSLHTHSHIKDLSNLLNIASLNNSKICQSDLRCYRFVANYHSSQHHLGGSKNISIIPLQFRARISAARTEPLCKMKWFVDSARSSGSCSAKLLQPGGVSQYLCTTADFQILAHVQHTAGS